MKQKTGGGSSEDFKINLTDSELIIYEIVGSEYFLGDEETNEEGFNTKVIFC